MFIKAFSPDHFNHGGDAPFEILRFSTKGLDRGQIKRANMFSQLVDGYTPAKGKTAVHTIAMTAFEKFGYNRNGDGWKRASLVRDHPTFISHAKVYRHHKNTPADPSFGQVKAAIYNEEMDRVELLMELDNSKCAEELNLLERDGSYPVSMACKIAHDVCSVCENKAKTPKEYCWHVKEALGKILDDGRVVGVDNPTSTFFDISRVIRPADRVAYTLKRASVEVLGGAALAEELGYSIGYNEALDASLTCSYKAAQGKRAVLAKLSKMEKRIEGEVRPVLADDEATCADVVKKLAAYVPTYLDSVMRGMCKEAVVLRPAEFYTLMTGSTLDPVEAKAFNKTAVSQAITNYSSDDLIGSALYEPAQLSVGGKIAELCAALRPHRGVGNGLFNRITGVAGGNNNGIKVSSTCTLDTNWSKEYVRYQLEVYSGIKNSAAGSGLDEALFCGFCQNIVE